LNLSVIDIFLPPTKGCTSLFFIHGANPKPGGRGKGVRIDAKYCRAEAGSYDYASVSVSL
jgi:hypothetical protein